MCVAICVCRLWPDVARRDDAEGRRGADRPRAGQAGGHARLDLDLRGGVLVLRGLAADLATELAAVCTLVDLDRCGLQAQASPRTESVHPR